MPGCLVGILVLAMDLRFGDFIDLLPQRTIDSAEHRCTKGQSVCVFTQCGSMGSYHKPHP